MKKIILIMFILLLGLNSVFAQQTTVIQDGKPVIKNLYSTDQQFQLLRTDIKASYEKISNDIDNGTIEAQNYVNHKFQEAKDELFLIKLKLFMTIFFMNLISIILCMIIGYSLNRKTRNQFYKKLEAHFNVKPKVLEPIIKPKTPKPEIKPEAAKPDIIKQKSDYELELERVNKQIKLLEDLKRLEDGN